MIPAERLAAWSMLSKTPLFLMKLKRHRGPVPF